MKASIFTRITNREILNWIQDQSQSAPLLMVVGGYNGTTALNDVELISTQGKKCVKPIRPIGEVKSYLFRLRRISVIILFCRLPNNFSSGSCQGVVRQSLSSHLAIINHRLENRCVLKHISNMNFQSWVVLGSQGCREKKIQTAISMQLLRSVFFMFSWSKKLFKFF